MRNGFANTLFTKKVFFIIFIFFAASHCGDKDKKAQNTGQSSEKKAAPCSDSGESGIIYLPASSFPELSIDIKKYLIRNGLKVPQLFEYVKEDYYYEPMDYYHIRKAVNVTQGHFLDSKKTAWAVLGSRDQKSVLFLFPGSSAKEVMQVYSFDDQKGMQRQADGQRGFSIEIQVISKKSLLKKFPTGFIPRQELLDNPGNIDKIPITHDGIHEIFSSKGSRIFYYHQGEWFLVAGSD